MTIVVSPIRVLTAANAASVLHALDTLALAITDAGLVWTDEQRSSYEIAVSLLRASDGCKATDSSVSG